MNFSDTYIYVGIVGMILILLAFMMEQTNRWKNNDLKYDLTNLCGSFLLVIYAISGSAWPFFILNFVWGLVSLRDVVADLRILRKKTKSVACQKSHSRGARRSSLPRVR